MPCLAYLLLNSIIVFASTVLDGRDFQNLKTLTPEVLHISVWQTGMASLTLFMSAHPTFLAYSKTLLNPAATSGWKPFHLVTILFFRSLPDIEYKFLFKRSSYCSEAKHWISLVHIHCSGSSLPSTLHSKKRTISLYQEGGGEVTTPTETP